MSKRIAAKINCGSFDLPDLQLLNDNINGNINDSKCHFNGVFYALKWLKLQLQNKKQKSIVD
jgi:hypothetical protein